MEKERRIEWCTYEEICKYRGDMDNIKLPVCLKGVFVSYYYDGQKQNLKGHVNYSLETRVKLGLSLSDSLPLSDYNFHKQIGVFVSNLRDEFKGKLCFYKIVIRQAPKKFYEPYLKHLQTRLSLFVSSRLNVELPDYTT